ncbi:hypothetical protein [Streptomyces sp. x-80]|uniref:hypothetical protein n=1 Tax=Streptomyces sp. x-80 TaxID=2789282 RepID=UPI00397F1307
MIRAHGPPFRHSPAARTGGAVPPRESPRESAAPRREPQTTSTSTAEPTPLVDAHAHFVTPHYVDAARAAGHRLPDGMPGCPPGLPRPTWS